MRSSAALLLLPALAAAQQPFPIVTKSVPTQVVAKISSDYAAYLTSVIAQPAYTSAVKEMVTASDVPAELVDAANTNPIELAQAFLTATATPSWYPGLPSDLQAYVSSIANAGATIAAKDSGVEGRRGLLEGWATWAVGAVAGVVGMALL